MRRLDDLDALGVDPETKQLSVLTPQLLSHVEVEAPAAPGAPRLDLAQRVHEAPFLAEIGLAKGGRLICDAADERMARDRAAARAVVFGRPDEQSAAAEGAEPVGADALEVCVVEAQRRLASAPTTAVVNDRGRVARAGVAGAFENPLRS
jgi:hypothetical protein